MPNYICQTCGAHYAEHSTPPRGCKICEDERQYVHREGQSWTTLTEATAKHDLVIRPMESNLYGIGIEPSFAIGQRALLLRSSQGNILWDCIPLINDQIIQQIKKLGGLDMIAISHPHYYTGLSEWSKAFGGRRHGRAPVRRRLPSRGSNRLHCLHWTHRRLRGRRTPRHDVPSAHTFIRK